MPAVFTSDEDVRDGQGRREHPSLRPGPSPDLLLTRDLSGSLVCLDRQRASALDLSASDWRYRAALRLGGPDGAGLAHVPMILCHSVDVRSTNGAVGTAREALRAWGRGGRIEASSHGRRVRRDLRGSRRSRLWCCSATAPSSCAAAPAQCWLGHPTRTSGCGWSTTGALHPRRRSFFANWTAIRASLWLATTASVQLRGAQQRGGGSE